MMRNTIRAAKKEEVHPLCSRKRSLMRIVDSPSYQKRRAMEKENAQTLKKSKTEPPKFDYLRRKSRYGDDFLLNKPESRKSLTRRTDSSKLVGTMEMLQEDCEGSSKAPPRVPLSAVGRRNHPPCSRRKTLAHIPSSSLSGRTTAKSQSTNLSKPASRPLHLPTRSPGLKKARDELPGTTKHYPPTRSPFLKKKKKSIMVAPKALPLPTRSPNVKRRHTMMPSKTQAKEKYAPSVSFSLDSPSFTSTTRKPKLGTPRRCSTIPKWKADNIDEEEQDIKGGCTMTPWKNCNMSMRERLDLWLASKNKCLTPHKSKSFAKSPHPNRRSKSLTATSTPRYLVKLSEEGTGDEGVEPGDECLEREDAYNEDTSLVVGELGSGISKELEQLLGKADDKTLRGEVEQGLNGMVEKYTTVVKLADYWICKARLAAQDDDVQRVVCMLEQAHAFQAQPGERIKEEICRYLQLLEDQELNNDGTDVVDEDILDEQRAKLISLYAITPGRRVHFAAQQSPLDFKSSVIRFCLLESKAFKRKLKEQLKRKVLTPVRRSVRVRRSEGLPEYLRSDSRVIESPGEVEDEIVEGEVSFLPNNTINTPLNNGWLVQDERETHHDDDQSQDHQEDDQPQMQDDEVEHKNGQDDEVEQKSGQDDEVEQKNGQDDEVEQKSGQEDEVEQKNGQEDEVEQKNDQEDEVKLKNDQEDEVEKKNDQKDEVEEKNDQEDEVEQKNDHEDEIELKDGHTEIELNDEQGDVNEKKMKEEDKKELENERGDPNENVPEKEREPESEPVDRTKHGMALGDESEPRNEEEISESVDEQECEDELRLPKLVQEGQEEKEEEVSDASALELSFM